MKIGVGFRNGIGNFIILTSILRCLAHHSGGLVDVIIEDEWGGETREAVSLIASKLTSVDRVVMFPSKFDHYRYDQLYMSTHSGFGPLLTYILGEKAADFDRITAWGDDFYHERDHYLMEIMDQFGYTGPIFDQEIEIPEKCFDAFDPKTELIISISNGYLRTASGIWKKKTYNRWDELLYLVSLFYEGAVSFVVLGGEEDREWGEELCKSLEGKVDITNLASTLDILQTAAVIKESDAIISTDTGVYHIADALHVPGVVLFGPTLVSKNGPLNGSIVPIQTSMECGGCQGTIYMKACNGARCMDEIPPSLILSVLRKIIL